MLDFSNASLDIVSVHYSSGYGNDKLHISASPAEISDPSVEELLKRLFLGQFRQPEYYRFRFSNGDFKRNPMYGFCHEILELNGNFHTGTVYMMKLLQEQIQHPKIKGGEVLFAYFSNLKYDGIPLDGIAICRMESKLRLLSTDRTKNSYIIRKNEGLSAEKPDKACLILNSDTEDAYRVCVYDRNGQGEESDYWLSNFLNLEAVKDEFHHTRNFMNMTRTFVSNGNAGLDEPDRTAQIELLNRSLSYFKSKDSFSQKEFETEVFQDEEVIDAFQKFEKNYRKENELDSVKEFDISLAAVKKESKYYRHVLKLDKNFHVYIHGNRSMLERGTDSDGRKYYKLYYDEES